MESTAITLSRIHLGKAACALDLGDGSERAEYVNQDYILHKLGRPHRCVNIMYTYYPHDKQWPQRISEACKDSNISFQWDYPYDDYFPFGANGQPFEQMRDIRRHGQDVLLTLTCDCSLSDEEIRAVARQLRPYGRMILRLNHECSGTWFTHNKRFTYEEIGAFFARFSGIVRQEAPNVRMMFCAGFIQEDGTVQQEEAFASAYQAADLWSADHYLSLHYGWPYDIAEAGGGQYFSDALDDTYACFEGTAKRLHERFGNKPFGTAETNADGDVNGPLHQGEMVSRFMKMIADRKPDWFRSVSMYQFRDRGRLGLEVEDPNNPQVGIEQPLLKAYRDEVMTNPHFLPEITCTDTVSLPVELRWGTSEDADGVAMHVDFEGTPEFCELTLNQEIGLMLELNGRWFYKAPTTKTIDLMPAFFTTPLNGPATLLLRLFAPPQDGLNPETSAADWDTVYRAALTELPALRIRYVTPGKVE